MGRTPPGQTRERVFQLVRDRILAGQPPTVREVQETLGFRSVQTAREHLELLVGEGRLNKEDGKSRGYRLPRAPGTAPTVMVPLLGRAQAGVWSAAVEDLEGYIPLQTRRASDQHFGLRVRGESMRDAGILPDDIVIVRRQAAADSGDIVVALVDDEATVKRLQIHRKRIELHPANPDFEILVPDPARLLLLGKVIEVRRRLGGA